MRRLKKAALLTSSGVNPAVAARSIQRPCASVKEQPATVLEPQQWQPEYLRLSGSCWSDPATATPLADFERVKREHPDQQSDWGCRAVALMNRKTRGRLLANANPTDLYGRRSTCHSGRYNLSVNMMLLGDDLPQIMIADKLGDGVVEIFANRDGFPSVRSAVEAALPNWSQGDWEPIEKLFDRYSSCQLLVCRWKLPSHEELASNPFLDPAYAAKLEAMMALPNVNKAGPAS